MVYIVIPIYSDPFLHPMHKNNKLSLLYLCEIDNPSYATFRDIKFIHEFSYEFHGIPRNGWWDGGNLNHIYIYI